MHYFINTSINSILHGLVREAAIRNKSFFFSGQAPIQVQVPPSSLPLLVAGTLKKCGFPDLIISISYDQAVEENEYEDNERYLYQS